MNSSSFYYLTRNTLLTRRSLCRRMSVLRNMDINAQYKMLSGYEIPILGFGVRIR